MKKPSLLLIPAALVLAGALFLIPKQPSAEPVPETEPPTEPEPTAGWVQQGDTRFYQDADGSVHTGWLKLDGQTYYLLDGGVPAAGWQTIDDDSYFFRSTGTMVTGWLYSEGQQYCLSEDGRLLTGKQELDGETFLLLEDGTAASGWIDLEDGRYYADEKGHPVTGWLELEGDTYYLREDGTMATGRVTIDSVDCFFASTGKQFCLVNPWSFIPEGYTVELSSIGGNQQIATFAYEDFQAMMSDCRAAGMQPVVCSSYRTQADQEYLYQRRIKRYMNENGYSREKATELAGLSVAVPGTSEHQLGLAVDIIDNRNWMLDESQAKMPTQQWLMENCWDYGFILRYPNEKSDKTGIIYEPWHYRYVGRELSSELRELGICLEEYVDMLTKETP